MIHQKTKLLHFVHICPSPQVTHVIANKESSHLQKGMFSKFKLKKKDNNILSYHVLR